MYSYFIFVIKNLFVAPAIQFSNKTYLPHTLLLVIKFFYECRNVYMENTVFLGFLMHYVRKTQLNYL